MAARPDPTYQPSYERQITEEIADLPLKIPVSRSLGGGCETGSNFYPGLMSKVIDKWVYNLSVLGVDIACLPYVSEKLL